jgi:hypothetical protein
MILTQANDSNYFPDLPGSLPCLRATTEILLWAQIGSQLGSELGSELWAADPTAW